MSGQTKPANGIRVLVVDDEESVRSVLGRLLDQHGYEVRAAPSGPAALELLRRQRFALALCDVVMPAMSGVELVRKALAVDPELAIVMLSGVDQASTAAQALTAGAFDYLTKPFTTDALLNALQGALHKRYLNRERHRTERVNRIQAAVRTAQVESLTVALVETLVNAMEAKDVFLRGHSRRVAELGASIAEELGLDDGTVERIELAGKLHDVGKIGIRESVLNKPGKLTDEEFEHVKGHVRIGMEILSPLTHLGPVLDYVRDHHEHWDGRGYARGLKGEQISIGGRVLAAADAFDALVSRRAYRDAFAPGAALDVLAASAGTLLDARVFDALRAVVGRGLTRMLLDEEEDGAPAK